MKVHGEISESSVLSQRVNIYGTHILKELEWITARRGSLDAFFGGNKIHLNSCRWQPSSNA